LVDRSGRWPELQAQAEQTRTQADRAGREIQAGARAAIGYFQRLAAARAQSRMSPLITSASISRLSSPGQALG
jgi:hypothetical protein